MQAEPRRLLSRAQAAAAGARDPVRGAAVVAQLASEGLPVALVELDTGDEASIAAAADTIGRQPGRLDVLVNNAGIADPADAPAGRASLEAVRTVLETNFTGTLAVTQAMLPLLRRSPAPRVVNLSSALGSLAINGDPASPFYDARLIGYNASKAAVNMLTVQLAAELGEGAVVVSVSPGFVRTDLTGGAGVLTAAQGAATPVRYALHAERSDSGRHFGPEGELPW